jgi:FKBP-type peptidyl-prolyl cis-trans isomerase
MSRHSPWLAVIAIVAVLGCQESKPEASKSAGTTGSGTTSGATGTTSTTTTTATESGMSATAKTEAPAAASKEITLPSGLKYEELTVGTGAEATSGKQVSIHYTGWLTNGTKFDSSLDRGQPLEFTLGAGQMIPGFDAGVAGMKVGGKRKLTIPPDLAYGAAGRPPVIPPSSTLIFDVQLVDVR